MSPIELIAIGLQLLRDFAAAGRTPDRAFTAEELEAASKAAHAKADELQALIDSLKGKKP